MGSQVSRTRDDATRNRTHAASLHRRVSGPCLAVLLSVGASAALGQPLPCPDIQNDAERLACYDRALRPDRAPAAPSAETAPTPQTAPSPQAAPPPAAAPSASAAAPAAAAKDEIVTIVITGV